MGEIRFKRTVYKNKFTGKCYTHLDSVLGLDKYKYLDPKLEATIVAKMAHHSMAEAARQINSICSNSFDKPVNFISRQLARNIMLRTNFDYTLPKVITPKSITVMLDEKFVKLQKKSSTGSKSIMVKSAVIYDGIKKVSKGRTKLINKRVFIAIDRFRDNFYDFLCSTYDISKIERINVIGDGASWIKSVGKDLKSTDYEVRQYLDLFHFRKALHHVVKDDKLKDICEDYIVNNKRNFVNDLFNAIDIKTTIGLRSKDYILTNFNRIKATFDDKISCSMEGHISHNLASLYSARPRGYSKRSLSKLIKLREAYLNGVDVADNILSNRASKPNQVNIDYSIFDDREKDTYTVRQDLKMIN